LLGVEILALLASKLGAGAGYICHEFALAAVTMSLRWPQSP
jgi:hypothetical protein